MKLSKVERLILINQYDILEKLNPNESGIYAINKKILEEGYIDNYGEVFGVLPDELPEGISQEVWDILQMYRTLNFSYRNLTDKRELEETDIKFKGFDGNNETKYMIYARFVMHDMDRYQELWDDSNYPNYNSHRPMLGKYRRMLGVWRSISQKHNNNLTVDEIKLILNA